MKLKKQFDDFYDKIRITDESDDLKEKREILVSDLKDNYPSELENYGIDVNKSDIDIFDQGSYKYNTTINTEPYDRDVAVAIPLDINEHQDPREVKKALRNALNKVPARTVKIKEPCVNVAYFENGNEWMHIDLPVYAKKDDKYYLARGREYSENYSWEEADPHGLNDYFLERLTGDKQKRRMIRFIKKWRDVQYENSKHDHEVPPSIGLTLLVCDIYHQTLEDGKHNDLEELHTIFEGIKSQFSVTYEDVKQKADITKYLPVTPRTDVFQKMKDSSDEYCVKFYDKVCSAFDYVESAINADDDHEASTYMRKLFGYEFDIVPKDTGSSGSSFSRREHSFGAY